MKLAEMYTKRVVAQSKNVGGAAIAAAGHEPKKC